MPPSAPSNMCNQQGQRCWGHAIDPAGLANGLRLDGRQLLTSLVRQTFDPRIVEPLREGEALVPAEGGYVGGLAAQVDMILGVDLELIQNPGGEVAEARPDPPDRVDPNGREGQEIESAATLAVPVQGKAISFRLVRRE